VVLGVGDLVPGVDLGLPLLHDLLHLAPGLLLAAAGAHGGTRVLRAANGLAGATYLVVGGLSLVVPGQVPTVLGIPTLGNLVHLALGAVLVLAALERPPFARSDARGASG
jgi:hypothetical protein